MTRVIKVVLRWTLQLISTFYSSDFVLGKSANHFQTSFSPLKRSLNEVFLGNELKSFVHGRVLLVSCDDDDDVDVDCRLYNVGGPLWPSRHHHSVRSIREIFCTFEDLLRRHRNRTRDGKRKSFQLGIFFLSSTSAETFLVRKRPVVAGERHDW